MSTNNDHYRCQFYRSRWFRVSHFHIMIQITTFIVCIAICAYYANVISWALAECEIVSRMRTMHFVLRTWSDSVMHSLCLECDLELRSVIFPICRCTDHFWFQLIDYRQSKFILLPVNQCCSSWTIIINWDKFRWMTDINFIVTTSIYNICYQFTVSRSYIDLLFINFVRDEPT